MVIVLFVFADNFFSCLRRFDFNVNLLWHFSHTYFLTFVCLLPCLSNDCLEANVFSQISQRFSGAWLCRCRFKASPHENCLPQWLHRQFHTVFYGRLNPLLFQIFLSTLHIDAPQGHSQRPLSLVAPVVSIPGNLSKKYYVLYSMQTWTLSHWASMRPTYFFTCLIQTILLVNGELMGLNFSTENIHSLNTC